MFTVLHTFSDPLSGSEDGALPAGPPTFSSGYVYGVSSIGGDGGGTLFKISTDGAKFFLLHAFSPAAGGSAGLTLGRDSSFYGVSAGGGTSKTGTIFRVTFPKSK